MGCDKNIAKRAGTEDCVEDIDAFNTHAGSLQSSDTCLNLFAHLGKKLQGNLLPISATK